MLDDDPERLRDLANADAAERSRQLDPGPTAAPAIVATTKSLGAYPTVAGRTYACESQVILGTESEGSTPALTSQGDTFFAFNLGSAVPPSGTIVLCRRVSYAWVFRYDG